MGRILNDAGVCCHRPGASVDLVDLWYYGPYPQRCKSGAAPMFYEDMGIRPPDNQRFNEQMMTEEVERWIANFTPPVDDENLKAWCKAKTAGAWNNSDIGSMTHQDMWLFYNFFA